LDLIADWRAGEGRALWTRLRRPEPQMSCKTKIADGIIAKFVSMNEILISRAQNHPDKNGDNQGEAVSK